VDTLGLTPARSEPGLLKSIFWANLGDDAGIQDAARHGYYACLFVCVTTFAVMLFGGTALGAFVDIFFFLMAGFGTRQFSRLAAVSAFVMLLGERVAEIAGGQVRVLGVMGLFMCIILFNAIRASYAAQARGLAPPAPSTADSPDFAQRVENLPGEMWPRLRVAFMFYLVGFIAMMLVGVVVRKVGLLQ
jgi:hypothetical protein